MPAKFFLILFLWLPVVAQSQSPSVIVLGIAQDGGFPHIGCAKECCEQAWANDSLQQYVVSLALTDPENGCWYLFEATPDISDQLRYFQELTAQQYPFLPAGIFITHAHIGHYTGLMQLGREVLNAGSVPVYALPQLREFLQNNGPWSQLVSLQNIRLIPIESDSAILLGDHIRITAFRVPHRDEYSETAGFQIETPVRKYLFIPDINKWESFERDMIAMVQQSDIAFLDATFYSGDELGQIDITKVPHPFVVETMEKFSSQDIKTKNKIHFIHLNHTNPLLQAGEIRDAVQLKGFYIAVQGMKY
jgi:pyrroloquinoline quinone biosynthesis protein B